MFRNLFNTIYILIYIKGFLFPPDMTMCPYSQLKASQWAQVNKGVSWLKIHCE